MKPLLLPCLLIIAFAGNAAAGTEGVIQRVETTPVELYELSITFERLAFTFPQPVQGKFWIEFHSADKLVKKHPVPNDAVPAVASFALSYVQLSDHAVFVSATTTHDGRADRRTGSYGHGNTGGSRTVTFKPASDKVPLGTDIELFHAEIKPGYRRPNDPVLHYRIMAHFTPPP